MNLYWVETEDHDEDWFIVASSSAEASRLHELNEGYGNGDALAYEVANIHDTCDAETGWPGTEVLIAVGAIIHSEKSPRVVELNGKVYAEGMLDAHINELVDNVFESKGDGRPNKTIRADPEKWN